MAITTTTLTAAMTSSDVNLAVASTTGITTPNNQTGTGITMLRIDEEYFYVQNSNTTTLVVAVARAQEGSVAAAHTSGSTVFIGLPSDFGPKTIIAQKIVSTLALTGQQVLPGVNLTGSADAIPAGVSQFYVVKTAGVDAMTLAAPTAEQEGNIINIWSATANAHTVTATALFAAGLTAKTTATFPAFIGAGMTLRVCNLLYHVISSGSQQGTVVFT